MPRKRINLGLKQRYGHEALLKAVEDVRNKKYTMRKASEIYKVPLSTLCDNVNGKSQSNKIGAKPKLNTQTEEILADYFSQLIQSGFNPTYNHVNRIISEFLVEHNLSHLFKNGCPGRDWYYEFKKRWRHKFEGTSSSPISQNRQTSVSSTDENTPVNSSSEAKEEKNDNSSEYEEKMDSFVASLTRYFSSFDYSTRPENIWTLDEISLTLECSKTSNNSTLLQRNFGDRKQQIFDGKSRFTLVSCSNALGECLPPFIIYKSKYPKYDKLVDNPRLRNSIFCSSPSGWTESEQLIDWFRDPFIERIESIDGPKLLIVEPSLAENFSMEILELASSHDVHLISPPKGPTAALSLNPLEVGVHRHVRNIWRKILQKYVLKTNADHINRNHLPYLISKLYEKAFTSDFCSNGFAKTGFYPIDFDIIKSKRQTRVDKKSTSDSLEKAQVESNGNSDEVIETEVILAVNVLEEVATTSQEVNVKESRTNEWVKSTNSDRSSRTTSIDVEAEDKEEELQFKPPPPPMLSPAQQSPNQNNNTLQQNENRPQLQLQPQQPIPNGLMDMSSHLSLIANTNPTLAATQAYALAMGELVRFRNEIMDRIERVNDETRSIQMSMMEFFERRTQLMMPPPITMAQLTTTTTTQTARIPLSAMAAAAAAVEGNLGLNRFSNNIPPQPQISNKRALDTNDEDEDILIPQRRKIIKLAASNINSSSNNLFINSSSSSTQYRTV